MGLGSTSRSLGQWIIYCTVWSCTVYLCCNDMLQRQYKGTFVHLGASFLFVFPGHKEMFMKRWLGYKHPVLPGLQQTRPTVMGPVL